MPLCSMTYVFRKILDITENFQSASGSWFSSGFSGHGGQTKEEMTTYSGALLPQHRPPPQQPGQRHLSSASGGPSSR